MRGANCLLSWLTILTPPVSHRSNKIILFIDYLFLRKIQFADNLIRTKNQFTFQDKIHFVQVQPSILLT